MANMGLSIAAKRGAEAGATASAFLQGFVFDAAAEATKQEGETIVISDYRGSVSDADTMGSDGYFAAGAAEFLTVKLDNHIITSVPYSIVDDATTPPAVWEGFGEALGPAVSRGIVKAALKGVTALAVTAEAAITTSPTKAKFTALFGATLAANLNPAECVLLLDGVTFSALLGVGIGDTAVAGMGLVTADFPKGVMGFGRVTATNLLPAGVIGVIAHKSAIIVGARPLPSDGSVDNYAVGTDGNGFSFNVKRVINPQNGKRYLVGECLVGVTLDPAKMIRVVATLTPAS